MRNLLIAVLFIMLMIPVVAQENEETIVTIPDLSGLTLPEAAKVLNENNMLLDPIILSLDSEEQEATLNTIVAQSPEAGTEVDPETETIVTISVLRDFNVLLVYYNEALERQGIETDHFTIINLGESEINIDGIVFQSDQRQFVASKWRDSIIKLDQCFQLWSNPNNGIHQPSECGTLAGTGILQDVSTAERFWKETTSFTVMQDGVYRGTCDIAAGRCELWVSPQMIAEEVTEYAYFVYDEHELVVYNRSETQWMPLHQIQLNDFGNLNNLRLWSTSLFEVLTFLAPQQCVIFSDNSRDESLVECDEIAQKNSPDDNIFWRDGFTVISSHEYGTERTCPPPNGQTFCLIPRYDLDR